LQAKKEEEVKISIGWYFIWFSMIGFLVIFSVWMIWQGAKNEDASNVDSLFKIVAGITGLGIAVKMSLDVIKAIRGIKGPKWRYRTLVRCLNCKFQSEREFKEGEYVGKKWDDPCPACGGPMVIELIYAKPPEERRSLL